MNIDINSIWAEKYRPQTVDDIVLTDDIRDQLIKYKNERSIPHLLLVGKPGVGKTTVGRVIIKDVLNCQHLYINASDESGIDTIRNKVVSFAQTLSIDGGIKVILLDECDGLSGDAQRALRNTMEEYSQHARFILTANYGHRIIPAVKSRCTELILTPPIKEAAKRIIHILKAENVENYKSQTTEIINVIKSMYPDMRRMINYFQKCTTNNILTLGDNRVSSKTAQIIYKLIQDNKPLEARKYAIQNETEFDNDYPHLLKGILHQYYNNCKDDDKIRTAAVTIAEHLYQSAFAMDQEINFTACIVKLSS